MIVTTLAHVLLLTEPSGWDEPTDEPADEPAGETFPASAPAAGQAPPAAAVETKERYNQWSLQIAPGGEFIFPAVGNWNAYGPTFRFAAWVHAWRGNFLIGGGPSVHWSYLLDNTPSEDRIQLFTVNGDMVIGGGKAGKVAGFGHLTFGGGVLYGKDGETGTKLLFPGIRAGAGAGVFGFVHPKVSLGGLVDFGWLAGLGVDAFFTVGIHFGKKDK